ncbi:ABC transporter substrate-binding protein [Allostella sp. ATCC 35155]|nr:ABC transporter substrate-binding protein [Stella sp. ATCC 35155]
MRSNTACRLATATFSLIALAFATPGGATAAEWPSKPIEFIVPWSPGGGTDQVGRALAPILSEILGTPIPVINKPGGAGVVGHTAIRQAEPDGYTFGFITPQLLTAPILGTSKLSFTELTPLAMVNSDPGAVTVAANAPWTSLQEFVAHAKANPGKVRVGNSGKGGTWHMVAVELERKADLKLVHVPYNGAAPATRDMLGGHIEAVTVSAAEVRAQVEGGLARMLAVTAPERVEAFSSVPTAKSQGLDITLGTWRGLALPPGVPAPVVERMQAAVAKAVADPRFKQFMEKQGFGIRYLDGPAFMAFLKAQDAAYREFFGS